MDELLGDLQEVSVRVLLLECLCRCQCGSLCFCLPLYICTIGKHGNVSVDDLC